MKSYFSFSLNAAENYNAVKIMVMVKEKEHNGGRWGNGKIMKRIEGNGEGWRWWWRGRVGAEIVVGESYPGKKVKQGGDRK